MINHKTALKIGIIALIATAIAATTATTLNPLFTADYKNNYVTVYYHGEQKLDYVQFDIYNEYYSVSTIKAYERNITQGWKCPIKVYQAQNTIELTYSINGQTSSLTINVAK
jgi:hypothetical protein